VVGTTNDMSTLRRIAPDPSIDDKVQREPGQKIHMAGNETIAGLTNEGTSFSIYPDSESKMLKTVFPTPDLHHENVKILDMAYSEAEG